MCSGHLQVNLFRVFAEVQAVCLPDRTDCKYLSSRRRSNDGLRYRHTPILGGTPSPMSEDGQGSPPESGAPSNDDVAGGESDSKSTPPPVDESWGWEGDGWARYDFMLEVEGGGGGEVRARIADGRLVSLFRARLSESHGLAVEVRAASWTPFGPPSGGGQGDVDVKFWVVVAGGALVGIVGVCLMGKCAWALLDARDRREAKTREGLGDSGIAGVGMSGASRNTPGAEGLGERGGDRVEMSVTGGG